MTMYLRAVRLAVSAAFHYYGRVSGNDAGTVARLRPVIGPAANRACARQSWDCGLPDHTPPGHPTNRGCPWPRPGCVRLKSLYESVGKTADFRSFLGDIRWSPTVPIAVSTGIGGRCPIVISRERGQSSDTPRESPAQAPERTRINEATLIRPSPGSLRKIGASRRGAPGRTERVWPVTANERAVPRKWDKRGGTAIDSRSGRGSSS